MWKTIGIGRSRSVVFLFFDHDEKAFRDVVSTAHFRHFVFIFFVFVCFFWLYIIVLRLCGSIRVDTERSETWDLRVRKTYTKRVKKERALIGTQFCDFCVSSSVCCVT